MTRKQVNAIYRAAKENRVACPAWVFDELYRIAEYPRRMKTPGMRRKDQAGERIMEAVFSGDFKAAQRLIELYSEDEFRRGNVRRNKYLIGRPDVEIIEDLWEE